MVVLQHGVCLTWPAGSTIGSEALPLATALPCRRAAVVSREKEIGGSGGSLEPPGTLPMHLHTVYMAYSECLPTL